MNAPLARSRPALRRLALPVPLPASRLARPASTTSTRPHHHRHRLPLLGLAAGAAALFASLSFAAYTREPLCLDAPPSTPAPASASDAAAFHLDPSTSLPLPRDIPLPNALTGPNSNGGKAGDTLCLVASGVRTVSFLRVQVYVAALYVPRSSLTDLTSAPLGEGKREEASLEERMAAALERGMPAVLRIVPVRNTDFAHLRDGFARAVQQRVKALRRRGAESAPSEEQEEALAAGVQQLKECFPKASLKKGEELDLVFHPSASGSGSAGAGVDLSLEHKGQVLGTVRHAPAVRGLDVAKLLLQAYVADKDPVSEVFKRALAERLSR